MSSTLHRTYSSPSLKANTYGSHYSRELQQEKYGYENDDYDDEFYVIGDRVYVDGLRPGSVAYFGEVEFAGGDWVGVVLDEPTGHHEGKVHGREYFQCAPMHGLFVRSRRLTRMPDSALGSSNTSSRVSTPLPSNLQRGRASCNSRSSGSALDSYYYDDDYRQEKVPTIESLSRKLRSIHERTEPAATFNSSILSYRPSNVDQTNRGATTPTTMIPINKSGGGILKRGPRSRSTEPINISSRGEEFTRRLNQASKLSPASRSPVFNFRPRRAQLEEFESPGSPPPIAPKGQVDLSSEPVKKGDRVVVRTDRGEMTGILRYLGETDFATGEWAGIELDQAAGRNDGSVLSRRYFYCPANYGLFVPLIRVRKYQSSQLADESEFSKSVRSTIKSPPPQLSNYNYNRSRSTTPSSTRFSSYSYTSPSYSEAGERTYSPSFQTKSLFEEDLDTHGSSLRPRAGILNSRLGNIGGSRDEGSRLLFGEYGSKFDDRDIDALLKKSLQKPSPSVYSGSSYNYEPSKSPGRSIKYTFSSSKYDGNPIARRTVEYK